MDVVGLKLLPWTATCQCLVVALTVFRLGSASPNSTKIYLLGLFPMSGSWAGGQAVMPAAELAVQDINANPEILPGYELAIISKDTQVKCLLVCSTRLYKSFMQAEGLNPKI